MRVIVRAINTPGTLSFITLLLEMLHREESRVSYLDMDTSWEADLAFINIQGV